MARKKVREDDGKGSGHALAMSTRERLGLTAGRAREQDCGRKEAWRRRGIERRCRTSGIWWMGRKARDRRDRPRRGTFV